LATDPEAIVLAHMRRTVISEMLRALPAEQAELALCAAIQDITQCANEDSG